MRNGFLVVVALAAVLALAAMAFVVATSSLPRRPAETQAPLQPPEPPLEERRVRAHRPEHATRPVERLPDDTARSRLRPFPRELRGPERLSGQVQDPDTGAPLPGVLVELVESRRGIPTGRPLATAVTDEHGGFVFKRLAKTRWMVRVRARGFETATQELKSGMDGTARIRTGRRRNPVFVLLDFESDPVAGAMISVRGAAPHELTVGPTDADGRISFLPPKATRLRFRVDGYADKFVHNWRSGPEHKVFLRTGHVLGGTVVDGAGRPLSGAVVEHPWKQERGKLVTDAHGGFHLTHIPAAPSVKLVIRAKGFERRIFLTPTGRDDLTVTLAREPSTFATVQGVVIRADGTPGADVPINLSATRTDDDGRFELTGLVAGEHSLSSVVGQVELPGGQGAWYREMGATKVVLRPGEVRTGVEIRLEKTKIAVHGVQVLEVDGTPARGVQVRGDPGRPTRTDENGNADVVLHVSPGQTARVAVGDATPTQSVQVVPSAAPDIPRTVIRLSSAPLLKITVKPAPARDDPPIEVRIQSLDSWGMVTAVRVSDARFEVRPPRGERLLAWVGFEKQGGVPRLIDPLDGDRAVVLDRAKGASIELRATDADGRPLGVIAFATIRMPAGVGRVALGRLTYKERHVFVGSNLPSGRYDLILYDRFRLVGVEAVSVGPGATKLNVRLPRERKVSGLVKDSTGKPLGGCLVRLRVPGGIDLVRPIAPLATTGAEGRFKATIPGIAGTLIEVSREGYAPRVLRTDGTLTAHLNTVVLPREGVVRIETDVALYVRFARVPGTDIAWEPKVNFEYRADRPDVWQVRALPEGAVELGIMRNDALEIHTVRVVASRETRLDLDER